MDFSVDVDIKGVTKSLNDLQKKQIPFATALALTKTAKDAQSAVKAQMPRKLNNPRPQTINAVRTKSATKRNLIAQVYFPDWAAEFMQYQVVGGREFPKSKRLIAPVAQRLNKYGNVSGMKGGNKIQKLLARPDVFQGEINGIAGIWKRYKNRRRMPKLLFVFKRSMNYQKRLPFDRIVFGVADNKLARNFDRALLNALQTAK